MLATAVDVFVLVSFLLMTLVGQVGSEEIKLGTTLVALKFDEGVVVAADTRTSSEVMVSNKFAKKINIIIDDENISCAICRSGSAADTQFLAKEAREEFRSRVWRYGFLHPSVSQLARFLRSKMRSESSGRDLQASLICAGYDGSGGRIFPIAIGGGAMWEEEVFCVSGSGSTFLLGYLDSLKLSSSKLYSENQAVDLIKKLLQLSISRDGASGGFIRMVILKKGGAEEKTFYPEMLKPSELSGFAAPQPIQSTVIGPT